MDGWRYTSKTTFCPLTYSTIDKTDSASCTNVLLLPFILCTRPIPLMIQVDGVGIVSAGDIFFSNSLANVALFVFRRDPSAFASVHGSGPSGGGEQCLIQDNISTSPSPTDRRAVVAPRGRARSSHWAIFLLNNIAITNNSTFPKIKLHYSISYCNKTKSNNLI